MILPETVMATGFCAASLLSIGYFIYCYLQRQSPAFHIMGLVLLVPIMTGSVGSHVYGQVEVKPVHIKMLTQKLSQQELNEIKELIISAREPLNLLTLEGLVHQAEENRVNNEQWPLRKEKLINAFPNT